MSEALRVAVLGGGPDAEREISLASSRAVAHALSGAADVVYEVVDRPDASMLRALGVDVIFPVLHGRFGEGGPLQDALAASGVAFVGCGPSAARLAMDKLATKLVARGAGVPTPEACVFDPFDGVSAIGTPAVVKPTHEGSSVALFVARDGGGWAEAHAGACAWVRGAPGRTMLVERFVRGRELTVGLLDQGMDVGAGLAALPIVEVMPAGGVYDFDAKYGRDDTRYVVEPDLPAGVAAALSERALAVARALGVRHMARADFMLPADGGEPMLLEINTMPGFTARSLLPMAAARAGLDLPALCAHLVTIAKRDGPAEIGQESD
ncbi:MAG: D-alanine--D-alanine ligase [Planctomycetota bacterium]